MYLELVKNADCKDISNNPIPKRINMKEKYNVKRRKKCDEVFSEYLHFMCERSNVEYCKEIIIFCLLYRECLNENSEELENKKQSLPESLAIHNEESGTEYCLVNNAEQIPDISNVFIAKYLMKYTTSVNITEMKELTYHFCKWLFFNGYTCSILSMKINNSEKQQDDGGENPEESKNLNEEEQPNPATVEVNKKESAEIAKEEPIDTNNKSDLPPINFMKIEKEHAKNNNDEENLDVPNNESPSQSKI